MHVTVVNAYSVHPPDHGGRYRMHGLYAALARHVPVEMVTLGLRDEGDAVIGAAPGLTEIRVARSEAHENADLERHREAGTPVYDITCLEHPQLTPDYGAALRRSLAGAGLLILAHPYMATAFRATQWEGPFVHDSHNFEWDLKQRMLPPSPVREALLAHVDEAEAYCCRASRLLFGVSGEDLRALATRYGDRGADAMVIPNGTDASGIAFSPAHERERLRRRLQLDERPIALFLASGHRPNLEAAEHVFRMARRMPQVSFAFVGNIADAFEGRSLPDNVMMVGRVSEAVRNVWLEVASVGLNPVLYGGGTNLKLVDYFAAGTPVVSTPIGLRGDVVEPGVHAFSAPIDAMDAAILHAAEHGPAVQEMTTRARALVEREFDWWALGTRMAEALRARGLIPASGAAGFNL